MKKILFLVPFLLASVVVATTYTGSVVVNIPANHKSLGAGNITAVTFLQASMPVGTSSITVIKYQLISSDGTNSVTQGGTETVSCSSDANGVMATSKSAIGQQNETGNCTTPSALCGSLSFSTSTGSGTCDFKISNTMSVGSATSNELDFYVEPLGAGTWTPQ